jgi:hypothetical protein
MSNEAVDTIKTVAKTISTNHLSAGDIWWRSIHRQIRIDMRPKPPKLIHANEKRRIAAIVMAGLSGLLISPLDVIIAAENVPLSSFPLLFLSPSPPLHCRAAKLVIPSSVSSTE